MERDSYVCQICKKAHPVKYAIHHIDRDKLNNKPENLVFLCQDCHNKKVYSRKFSYWTEFLRDYQNSLM